MLTSCLYFYRNCYSSLNYCTCSVSSYFVYRPSDIKRDGATSHNRAQMASDHTIHKKSHIIHKTKSHINTPFLRSFTLKKAQKTSVIFDFVNIQSSRRYFACLGPGTSIILHLRVAYWFNTNKEIFVRVSKSIYLTEMIASADVKNKRSCQSFGKM